MALTTYLISQASDHLSGKHVQLWLLLFRRLPKYKEYAFVYAPELQARLTAAEGTIKARMLNALMKEIDDLGVGEVSIERDREGTNWSQTLERNTLIEEALDVLFDDISTMVVPSPTIYSAGGFSAATGNRDVTVYCPVCRVSIIHKYGRTYCRCI